MMLNVVCFIVIGDRQRVKKPILEFGNAAAKVQAPKPAADRYNYFLPYEFTLQPFGLSKIVVNLQETTVLFLFQSFFVIIVGHIHEFILICLSNRIPS